MKNILLFIVSLAPFIITGQTQSDDILGTWLNEDKNGKIEIYQDGEKYFGKIITAKPPKNVNKKTEDALDKTTQIILQKLGRE